MKKTKALVLGYSVTAEFPGYVGTAQGQLPDIKLEKVGFGGLQPNHARYLFPSTIREHQPDIVILEQATPAFRSYTNDRNNYANSVLNILRICCNRNIRVGILDLPRHNTVWSEDWVNQCHRDLEQKFGIPLETVQPDHSYIHDEVHPTPAGRDVYAAALVSLIGRASLVKAEPSMFNAPNYDCIPACGLAPGSATMRVGRGAYDTDLLSIPGGSTVEVRLPERTPVRGFSTLMGPTTGILSISFDGENTLKHQSYDGYCYYARFGAFILSDAITCERISFLQEESIPDIKLHKGEKNTGPRIGAVGHVFIER